MCPHYELGAQVLHVKRKLNLAGNGGRGAPPPPLDQPTTVYGILCSRLIRLRYIKSKRLKD